MWNKFNSFIHVITSTSTFRNGDILGALSESLPLNFNIHPYASYLSICKVVAVSIPSALAK